MEFILARGILKALKEKHTLHQGLQQGKVAGRSGGSGREGSPGINNKSKRTYKDTKVPKNTAWQGFTSGIIFVKLKSTVLRKRGKSQMC